MDRALAASVAGLLKSQTTDEVVETLVEAAPVTHVQTPTRGLKRIFFFLFCREFESQMLR